MLYPKAMQAFRDALFMKQSKFDIFGHIVFAFILILFSSSTGSTVQCTIMLLMFLKTKHVISGFFDENTKLKQSLKHFIL